MAQAIRDEVIEELLQGYSSPDDLLGEEGLFKELKKRLLERALGAELTAHLGYEKGDPAGRGNGNSRNGYSSKTVIGDDGAIEIAVPRDRNSSFEPQIVAKGQTRLDGFDDRIISLYARGLSVREIQAHLQELYGVEVSPDLISRVTDAVLEEVREWQNRPLDPLYPVIFFLDINTIAMAVLLLLLAPVGALSDRYGRKPVLLIATGGMFLMAWPLFWMLHHNSPLVILPGQIGFAVLSACFWGTIPSTMVELVPARVRCTVLSLGYNTGMAIFGGLTPMVAVYTIKRSRYDLSPVFLLMAAAAVSFVVIIALRETYKMSLPGTAAAPAEAA
jgi:hypothetical protein